MQALGYPSATAGGIQFEGRTLSVGTAGRGSSVDIANRVENHASSGIGAVRASAVEVMQNYFAPSANFVGHQLEYCSCTVLSTTRGRAVEIPGTVED